MLILHFQGTGIARFTRGYVAKRMLWYVAVVARKKRIAAVCRTASTNVGETGSTYRQIFVIISRLRVIDAATGISCCENNLLDNLQRFADTKCCINGLFNDMQTADHRGNEVHIPV